MADTVVDVFVIGGGQAALPLVWALAGQGKRVALAERKYLGGSCVNFGCTPTKAAITSARVAHQARRAADYGLKIPTVEPDFPAVLERARRIAGESRHGLDQGLEHSDNPRLIRGHARLDGRAANGFRVRVGEQVFLAAQVVLNPGTRSFLPPIEGLAEVDVLHAGNWLTRPELPEHLALLGGGYIGLEMGQFYRRMGSRVTIIENGPRLILHEDADVSSALQERLASEGIAFRLNATLERVEAESEIVLHLKESDTQTQLRASHLFVATGRVPNTDDLGLETVGVEMAAHGYVKVDERLATNVAGIWAAGDVRGGLLFTHTSWDDYRILMSQMAGNGSRTTRRVVPYAVFTDPELGRVGMTETEARQTGKPIKVARFDMTHSGKASEIGEREGFIKVIADAETGLLLGAATLCADAAELIHLYSEVINLKAPYTAIRDEIYLHPTLSEAVQSAAMALDNA